MSATIDGNGVVTLAGDGFGVNWGRKQLVAAPVGAVKMQFVYRAYFASTPSASTAWTGKGWDSAAFLGLGFDNTIYDFSAADTIAPDDFLGICTTTKPYTTGPVYDNNAKVLQHYAPSGAYWSSPWGTVGGSNPVQKVAMLDGIGTALSEQSSMGADNAERSLMSFPYSPANGATITFMWEVWGSLVNNSVYMRRIRDTASLAEGDAMFTAFDGKTEGTATANYIQTTIHGDTTSNWRNAGSPGTMNFPRWLKYKFQLPSYGLVLKYWKIRYLDAANTVVREQAM